MAETLLKVTHEVGLHARPASTFVKLASSFESSVQVRNKTRESEWVDAKSILSVLTLGVEQNHEIELQIEGSDAEQAIGAISDLVNSDFAQ